MGSNSRCARITVSQLAFSLGNTGADERIRTADLLITNQLLYQLSYVGLNQASSDTSSEMMANAKQRMLAHGYELSIVGLIMCFFRFLIGSDEN